MPLAVPLRGRLAAPAACALAVLALALFRFWLAATLPLTGDEAYFVVWGEHPAGGYYDHPPMIGWWLAGLLHVSDAVWWLRLPAVLLPFVLAFAAWRLLRPGGAVAGQAEEAARARFAAMLILLQPAHVWNVLITTDTPLILFSFGAVYAYARGIERRSTPAALIWHAAAGFLLGAAFLSKYFAVLLGLALLLHAVCLRRDAQRWPGLAVLLLTALAAPLWNLWWNANNCWANVLFNVYNRNASATFDWKNPLLYAASLAYLATPWLLWALARRRCTGLSAIGRLFASAAGVPLAVLLVVALAKSVGLHWLLAFTPFLAILAALSLELQTLRRLLIYSALFALMHVAAAAGIARLPLSAWQDSRFYNDIVPTVRSDALVERLRAPLADCGAGCVLAMESYAAAAMLAHAAQRPVAVFGSGSFHGRQDDFNTDFRALDGRNFVILRKGRPPPDGYAPFFAEVQGEEFELDGVRFYVIKGSAFRYPVYRQRVLALIRERYYAPPPWLPQIACRFTGRYFAARPAAADEATAP